MIRPFYIAGGLLLLIIISMGVHYAWGDRGEVADKLGAIAGLTRMSSLSFSVAYYEPRLGGIDRATNIAYPEMMALDRMDFVYAK